MVKGINRQVIVVRSPDPSLFEQAIFLLRPDAPESCNVTQDELLRQAQAAAKGYSTAHIPGARLRSRLLGRLFWALAGGGAVGLVWLATSFFKKDADRIFPVRVFLSKRLRGARICPYRTSGGWLRESTAQRVLRCGTRGRWSPREPRSNTSCPGRCR